MYNIIRINEGKYDIFKINVNDEIIIIKIDPDKISKKYLKKNIANNYDNYVHRIIMIEVLKYLRKQKKPRYYN